MHYKNGRPAKEGDKVINLETGMAGILHSTSAQSNTCNGRLAVITSSDPWITIGQCLHFEDVVAATIPDSSKPT